MSTPVSLPHPDARVRRPRRERPRLSVRGVLLLVMALTALPMLLLLAYSLWDEGRDRREAAETAGLLAARLVASHVARVVESGKFLTTRLASDHAGVPLAPGACPPAFASLLRSVDGYRNIITVDARGDLVCSTLAPLVPSRNLGDRKWFKAATATGDTTVGDVTRGRLTGGWIVGIGHPIRDKAGQIVGVLDVTLDLDRLEIRPEHLPAHAMVGIIDGEGRLVARSIGQGAERPDLPPVGALTEIAPLVQLAAAPREAVVDIPGPDRGTRMFAVTPVAGTPWVAVASLPSAAAVHPTSGREGALVSVALGLFALLAILAAVLARWIARPIAEIGVAAHAIATGDRAARVPVTGPREVAAFAETFNDVLTRLPTVEGQLRRSEAQLSAVFETASEAILSLDADQCIVMANPAAAQLFGHPRTRLIGSQLSMLLPPDVAEHHAALFDAFALGRDAAEVRPLGRIVRGRHADGREFPLEASIARAHVGSEILLIVVARDISERQQQEQALRDLNESLESRVEERTQELERKNRELASFSYMVSHDLQAPVRAVRGYAMALSDSCAKGTVPDQTVLIERIVRNADRMTAMIEALLQLSRIGRTRPNRVPIDLGALAREVVQEAQAAQPSAKVEVLPLPRVNADPVLMRQLLANLVSNALKYSSKEARPLVEIGAHPCAAGHEIYVRDNGAGFDPQYAGKLFDAFQRLHNEREFPGLGIGLAICRSIVERHGGSIRAESAPGLGATFTFVLPEGSPPLA